MVQPPGSSSRAGPGEERHGRRVHRVHPPEVEDEEAHLGRELRRPAQQPLDRAEEERALQLQHRGQRPSRSRTAVSRRVRSRVEPTVSPRNSLRITAPTFGRWLKVCSSKRREIAWQARTPRTLLP